MKNLKFFEEELNKCSRCGLCQAVCPIYQITKNDCTSPKGKCIMLNNLLKSKNKPSKEIIKYMDTCSNCGKCLDYCPSKIDILKINEAFYKDYYIYKTGDPLFYVKNIFSLILKVYGFFKKHSIKGKIAYIKPYLQKEIPENIKKYNPEIIDSLGCDMYFITKNLQISEQFSKNIAKKLLDNKYDFIITDNIMCKAEADRGLKILKSSKKTIYL